MVDVNCSHSKMVNISELVQNPRNPNKHPKKQIELLARVIRDNGWRNPITVSTLTGFIVQGHGRYQAAQLLKLSQVPVDYQDFKNEAQEWQVLLADNKLAELADLDDDYTAQVLKEIEEAGGELELTGFSDSEVQKMLDSLGEDEEEPKPEVEFSEELHESSNYIVLYFDNDIDWLQALTLFNLKTVKALDSREGFEKMGIGRVVNGADAINKLMEAE